MNWIRAWIGMALCAILITAGVGRAHGQAQTDTIPREVRESEEYIKARGGPAPHIRTSAHFALRWGDDNKTNIKIDAAYLDKAMAWLESLWSLYIDKLHFPAGRHHYKINAYITGTGLKPFLDGYAYGFADPDGYGVLIGDPSIFTYGHNGAAHEFTHALEGETKGFRDSDYVGWFWECHAQFMSHQATGKSDLPHVLDRYAQTSHWDVASTRHHYGSWIFFQYLAERYPNGMDLINRLWIEPALNRDEDPIAKLRRTLPLTGNRDEAWADLIGDYAKHNVTWDFYKLGPDYRSALKFFDKMRVRNYFTYLEPSPSRAGWYRVPRIYAPQQNGYNIIPLTPAPGATKVSVDLAGFVEPAERSEWRATLVAIGTDDTERFSSTWSRGIGTMQIKADERLFLVVAATPLQHLPPRFVERYPDIPVFPYEIRCMGATPRSLATRIRLLPLDIMPGHRHPNGGGFVANTAHVTATAFVGKGATVLGRAHVEDRARIEEFATISGDAHVSGSAVISGNALVTGRARVEDEALVTDFAELYDAAFIHGRARVLAAGRVYGNNEVTDEAVVKGFASIRNVRRISGGAIADGEVEWDYGAPELTTDICFGTLLQPDPNRHIESNHLYARYAADGDSAWRVRDAFGSNDGVLHGGASLATDPERRRAILFPGSESYVDVPRELVLHRQMTLSCWGWLDSGRSEQHIATFGRDANHQIELLATDSVGKIALRLHNDDINFELTGPKPPLRRWFHVAVALGDTGADLYVNGKRIYPDGKPIRVRSEALHPDELRSRVGFLGRGLTGGHLTGRLTALSFFTTVLPDDRVLELWSKESGK